MRTIEPPFPHPLLTEICSFFVDAKPAVQGNHRISRAGHIFEASSASLAAWRQSVGWAAHTAMRSRFASSAPIALELGFRVHPPKRDPGEYPTRRPDLDKLVRACCDALTDIVYLDDSQIVSISASKTYGLPGCRIRAWGIVGEESA